MKKVLMVLMTLTMVMGFTAMASAQEEPVCTTCEEGAPGFINANNLCYDEQGDCYTKIFDYESFGMFSETVNGRTQLTDCNDGSYCEDGAKGDKHRALLNICKCIPDPFDKITADDIMDVTMTIKVDKGNGVAVEGANGVYWAENVNTTGIGVQPFKNAPAACLPPCDERPTRAFEGAFEYISANGNTTSAPALTGNNGICDIPANQRYVTIQSAANDDNMGFVVEQDDADNTAATWWIDIPRMVIDPTDARTGYKVYVSICITAERLSGNICSDCICCCDIYIGELSCCDSDTPVVGCTSTLTFPYLPKTETYWYGMAITNTGSTEGSVTVTVYENDGDVAAVTKTVPANSTMIIQNDWLVVDTVASKGNKILGNGQSYAKAVTNFPASGFGMMAKANGTSSMGYLAEKCGNCGNCD